MAGLRAVAPDALPALGGEAAVPLAALAATLAVSLLVGLRLSRARAGGRLPAPGAGTRRRRRSLDLLPGGEGREQ